MHGNSHKRGPSDNYGSIEFMCDRGDCGKLFHNRTALAAHLDLHENRKTKCYFCPWSCVDTKRYLQINHMNQHISEAELKCPYCNRGFFRSNTLKTHIEVKHEVIPGKYSCQKCSFKTHAKRYLQYHKCTKPLRPNIRPDS